MNLITVKTFDVQHQAYILKAKLKEENIEAYIFDEYVNNLDPLMNVAFGGIKLKVDEQDVERAEKVIVELDKLPVLDSKNEIITCPECNSSNIYSGYKSVSSVKGFFSFLVSILLFVFPLYQDKNYFCKDCKTEFSKK
ncbi:MAG: DUF2007 domain-containing protein [Flavobacteriales bacterium]|nr:DUF2007 domain-containing protein [Flavobacteriales bacterium]